MVQDWLGAPCFRYMRVWTYLKQWKINKLLFSTILCILLNVAFHSTKILPILNTLQSLYALSQCQELHHIPWSCTMGLPSSKLGLSVAADIRGQYDCLKAGQNHQDIELCILTDQFLLLPCQPPLHHHLLLGTLPLHMDSPQCL